MPTICLACQIATTQLSILVEPTGHCCRIRCKESVSMFHKANCIFYVCSLRRRTWRLAPRPRVGRSAMASATCASTRRRTLATRCSVTIHVYLRSRTQWASGKTTRMHASACRLRRRPVASSELPATRGTPLRVT